MLKEQPATHGEAQQTVPEDQRQERQPWHRPRLKRLRLSLDTAFTAGSNTDGYSGSIIS